MADLLLDLLRANAAGGLAVLAVMALRGVVRRGFGPDAAYRLWAAPPLVAAAALMPGRELLGAPALHQAPGWAVKLAPTIFTLWALGALAVFAVLAMAQYAFLRAARAGRAGPAVVGLVSPRIVMPPDDGRFSEAERGLMRAHERQHLERGDPCANALIAALQCLLWWNPLAHLAARLARLDQEIACDAAVLERRPAARALYARTLLKAQIAAQPLPLGARWSARAHPLETRIRLISRVRLADRASGPVVVGAGAVAACAVSWAMVPPVAPREFDLPRFSEAPQRSMSVLMIRTPPTERT